MALTYILAGFATKVLTGLDDTITRMPLLASVTNRRLGRIVFSVGSLLAILLGLFVSELIATSMLNFQYRHILFSSLLFALALLTYFDVLVHKPRSMAESRLQNISPTKLLAIFGVGFVASVATVFDDVIAFAPLLAANVWYSATGILVASVLEILLVVYFAKQINRVPHKEKIAAGGLFVLGMMVLLGVI